MKRTAFVLFVLTWALATVTAYVLLLVYGPVEAAELAFMAGAAFAMGLLPTWRALRRWFR